MKRTSLYLILLLAATGIFIARLFYIQIIDERYTLSAANNAQRIEKIFVFCRASSPKLNSYKLNYLLNIY